MVYKRTAGNTPKRSTSRLKKTVWIVVGLLVLAAITITILEVTNTTYWFHKRPFKPVATQSADTKGGTAPAGSTSSSSADKGSGTGSGSSSSGSASSGSNSGSGSGSGSGASSPTNSNVTLEAPSGELVSNHHVTTSDTLQSTCTTTSGATCKIIFTKDGVTKSLAAQGTDASGSTYWQWQPKTIGLTAGSWTVSAEADYGSQQQTSTDPLQLEVSE